MYQMCEILFEKVMRTFYEILLCSKKDWVCIDRYSADFYFCVLYWIFFPGFGSTDVVQEKKLEFRGPGWKNIPTYLYTVSVERGLSWEDALEILNEFDDNASGFYLSKNVCYIFLFCPNSDTPIVCDKKMH